MWSWWGLCPTPSGLGLVLSSASTTQAYFVLRFSILRWVRPLLFTSILQRIAAGIGTSNFLRAAFIVTLNSSSFGSIKNIRLNCLASSSFGFSTAHLCFAFFFDASDICFHISIWPYIIRTRGCLFPRKSLPGPCISVRWPFVQWNKSCEASPCFWQFFFSIHVPVVFKIYLQQYIQWCICCSGNVDVLHWNRKWFFFRHVQFDSGFHLMTINDSPVKVQKSLLASSSSRVESSWSGVGECNSSDFLWRISCSFPRSGRSRVKVDVLRSSSHVSRKSLEEAEVTHIPFGRWLLQFPSW